MARSSNGFPIVGVGASAGGLEAFTQLLKHLPLDTGFAFVLVQHLDPLHESGLTRLLATTTAMPVIEVTNNLRVRPNHVYVIPPNTSLGIAHGVLKLRPRVGHFHGARSIDFFFEMLAKDQRERAIGVILSGNASDGSHRDEASRIAWLERELAETRDYLASIQEHQEASNEELQASNEEGQSANEELQSLNEELETSKEELESTNEELTTVNEEMGSTNPATDSGVTPNYRPRAGEHEFTLSGNGSGDKHFHNSLGGVDFSIGNFISDSSELSLRQSINYGSGSVYSTLVAYDEHFGAGQLRPFLGANFGYVYGHSVKDTMAAGLEGGVKYYVLPKTFVFARADYSFLFRSSNQISNRFNSGAFFVNVGVGFQF